MNETKKEMIHAFGFEKIKFDFMGYVFNSTSELSYHHLIIPRRLKGETTFKNGAILRQSTSHDYLHIIERIDPEIFFLITSEMIDENIKRRIDIYNLKQIRKLLLYFEKEYSNLGTKKGKMLIKDDYIKERIKL